MGRKKKTLTDLKDEKHKEKNNGEEREKEERKNEKLK